MVFDECLKFDTLDITHIHIVSLFWHTKIFNHLLLMYTVL